MRFISRYRTKSILSCSNTTMNLNMTLAKLLNTTVLILDVTDLQISFLNTVQIFINCIKIPSQLKLNTKDQLNLFRHFVTTDTCT